MNKNKKINTKNITQHIKNAEKNDKILRENITKTLEEVLREKVTAKLNKLNESEEEEEDMDVTPTDTEDSNLETDNDFDTDVEDTDVEDDVDTETEGEFPVEDTEVEPDGEDSEWKEFDKYKVSDNEYDFTDGCDDVEVIKAFKLLNDEDTVTVVKQGDNIKVNDRENNQEIMIDLSDLDCKPNETEEIDIEGFSDGELDAVIESVLKDFGKHPSYGKEPFTTPSNEGGISGKYGEKIGDSDPYTETIVTENTNLGDKLEIDSFEEEEVEEGAGSRTLGHQNRISKKPQTAIANRRNGGPMRDGAQKVAESKLAKYEKELQALKEDRQNVVKTLGLFKSKLEEALSTNYNLGQVIKLFVENTTTKNEKNQIIQRFGSVKTIKEGKSLFETIQNEMKNKSVLSEGFVKKTGVSQTVKPTLKETKIYENNQVSQINSLMKRMK